MTDIVERLTHFGKGTKHTDPFPITQWRTILNEAADEIVRLRALITEWADAHDAVLHRTDPDKRNGTRWAEFDAVMAKLHEEANR